MERAEKGNAMYYLNFTKNMELFHEDFVKEENSFVKMVIDGSKCKNKSQLFKQFAKQFKFPSYFGNNWDAFHDCMTDLEWLEADAYALYVIHFEQLLAECEDDLLVFIELVEEIILKWNEVSNKTPENPTQIFKVVIHGDGAAEMFLQKEVMYL